MISGSPSLLSRSSNRRGDRTADDAGSRPTGIEPFVERHADRYRFYGSGKAALRDGLAGAAGDGTALLPSYLPDAVDRPFRDLGLAVDRYAVAPDLGPELADLESRLDDDVVAVVTVDYFGFPQPRFEVVADLAADRGCALVADAAHATLSVVDGAPLWTRGDVGIASLRKLFPVPDGAVLYVDDPATFEPSSLTGVAAGFGADDCRFVLASLASELCSIHPALRRSADALAGGAAPPDPADRYEAAKHPMSKLSRRLLADVDPAAVRTARRANYRAWERTLADREGVRPVSDRLPDGVCPLVCPVVADRPGRFLEAATRAAVGGVDTWPRLPEAVREDPAYGTARDLSRRLVTLPVHQDLDPDAVEAAGRRLSGEARGRPRG